MAIGDADGQLHAPAAEMPLHGRTDARLCLRQRLRHAELQIQMAMVDGADGDRHAGVLPLERCRREACHAFDHCLLAGPPAPLGLARWRGPRRPRRSLGAFQLPASSFQPIDD